MSNLAIRLHELFSSQPRFTFPFGQDVGDIPRNGIYLMFENGEKFCEMDRIVRVGTHTGKNQLLPRLNQHFLKGNKNRSIFRKNIGRCILNKEKSDYLPLWEIDTTSRAERERVSAIIDFDFERELEKRISAYIQTNLSFCIFKIDSKEERLRWESKIVSTLSRSTEPNSSPTWLGRHSTKQKIRESGLWQVNELYKEEITESELEELEGLISVVPNYNSI